MNVRSITHTDFARTVAQLAKPAPSINIVPTVMDFIGQSADRLSTLGRAANHLVTAAYGGQQYAAMMSAAEFATLKAFVQYADPEFALAGAGFGRDDAPDQQHSPDGYSHHLDREKM